MSKAKAKQPWFKFNPQDWRGDAKLRMCSIGARGLWMEMMCIMHEAEPYGHLMVGGRPPSNKQLAMLAGVSHRECEQLLTELELAGVFSKTEEGVIYSRRMMRDKAKQDKDRENGKSGGNPNLVDGVSGGVNLPNIPEEKGGVNPPDNREDKAKSPESRVQIKDLSRSVAGASRPGVSEQFEEFWMAYPSRDGPNPREPAERKFRALVKTGVDAEVMIAAIRKLAIDEKARGNVGTRYIPKATRWLNEQRWADHAAVAFVADSQNGDFSIEQAIQVFAKTGHWSRHAPVSDVSQAPAELLVKFGLTPDGRKREKPVG
jgi:hypothetical protein